jgi:hypothetical protein
VGKSRGVRRFAFLWEPDSQSIFSRFTDTNCGSQLAGDDGLTANQFSADLPIPIVGASLLAMAA